MTSLKNLVLCCFVALFCSNVTTAQVTIAFQGGEPGDNWGYTSTLASAIATGEALLAPNKVTGTTSIVVGGNTAGGSCFSGGSGNGPAVARTFTFNTVDISQSNDVARTLNFHWGNRFPTCNGTGWDAGENLVFTAYHNGTAQTPVTLVVGSNNAPYSIQANQYTWNIPSCVNTFSFVISVTTNRADELLFLDDVKITAPQLNGSSAQPSPITGPISVCPGNTATYSVINVPSTIYTWSGLPAGAVFTTTNGMAAANSIGVDWGTTAPGTYTLSVTPSGLCSGASGTPQTIDVTVEGAATPVVISGPTSFCAGSSITLASSYATGNTWSNGETTQNIDVFIAGTYTVTVQTACGTVTDSYTVTTGNVPAIQSVQATDASCFGFNDGSLTVNATGSSLEYSIDGTNWQSSPVFANLAPGTYTIHVRETGGCETTTTGTVSEPAALTVTAANDGPFCSGTTITLHATSNAASPTFLWMGPNGYSSTLSDPTDATEAGTYSVTAWQNGCGSSAESTIVDVIETPQASAFNSGPYCSGESIQLLGSTNLGTPVQYQWTGPNAYASTYQNPTDATQAGTYSLVINNNGCFSQPALTTVLINTIPDVAVAYNAPFCPGTPLLLDGTTSAAAATFSWTGPNGYASTLEDPADATQTGIYTLIVSANGCSSLPLSLTVSGTAPVVNAWNDGPACDGTAIQLNSAATASGPLTYSWTGPNGFTSTLPEPSGITEAGTYTLTVTDNGCSSSISTTVILLPLPVAAFTVGTPCALELMTYTSQSTATNPQNITAWEWNFGDGATSAAASPEHAYETSGDFSITLEVTTNAGCSASLTQNVQVSELPKANFYFTPDAISGYDPTVSFTNSSSFATNYQWQFDDGMTTPEFSPTIVFEGTSNHVIQLIAYNAAGCSDTISKVIKMEQSVVYFVPNAFTPDGDEFNNSFKPVFTEGFDPMTYSLVVYNRWGEVIFESMDPGTGWDGTYQGSLQTDGIYAWNIRFKHREDDAYETIAGHVTMLH